MQYVTSVERMGIAKGRQEGRQEGRKEGRQEEASKLFLLLLESKFGAVNQQLQEKVRTAKTPEDLLDS